MKVERRESGGIELDEGRRVDAGRSNSTHLQTGGRTRSVPAQHVKRETGVCARRLRAAHEAVHRTPWLNVRQQWEPHTISDYDNFS